MRLIDADALLNEMRHCKEKAQTFGRQYYRCGYISALSGIEGYIASMPAIDVEPVRHGRWINGECSECGEHAPYWSMSNTYYKSLYCYLCGAKMDLEG